MTESDVIARTPQQAAEYLLSLYGGSRKRAMQWVDSHRAKNFLLNPPASKYWGDVWDILEKMP